MAGDWLKVEANTPEKPEIFEIATQLKIQPIEAFARLFLVWRWFDQHTEDGNADSVTSAYLDHIAGVTGFADSMLSVGWLAKGPREKFGYLLPNFDRHNGQTAKKRALTAKRVATHKKRLANAAVTQSALPREEKRRSNPIVPSGQFLRFWTAWPKSERKQAQGKCWGVWQRNDLDQQTDVILAHVESLKSSDGWRTGYIPAPLVYLNQKRWEGAEPEAPAGLQVAL